MRHEVQRRRGSGVDMGSGRRMMIILEGEFGFNVPPYLAVPTKEDHIQPANLAWERSSQG